MMRSSGLFVRMRRRVLPREALVGQRLFPRSGGRSAALPSSIALSDHRRHVRVRDRPLLLGVDRLEHRGHFLAFPSGTTVKMCR